jgi:hypothetical protein
LKEKLEQLDATSINWEEKRIEKGFEKAGFWKPEEGVYSVEANLKDLIIKEGKYGYELWIRIKVENKEMIWSIPIADYKDDKIVVVPFSRAWHIKEIIKKYGSKWHKLIVEVKGKGREKKYILKHPENCGCKNG